MDSQLRLDVGDLKLGGRRFAPADSLCIFCIREATAFQLHMHFLHSVGNCISAAYAFSALFAFGGKLHLVAWIH